MKVACIPSIFLSPDERRPGQSFGSKSLATDYKFMLKSAEHELKLLRNTDVAKIKGKFRFIHHIDWSFINYTSDG